MADFDPNRFLRSLKSEQEVLEGVMVVVLIRSMRTPATPLCGMPAVFCLSN
jgi:hypothetical protein